MDNSNRGLRDTRIRLALFGDLDRCAMVATAGAAFPLNWMIRVADFWPRAHPGLDPRAQFLWYKALFATAMDTDSCLIYVQEDNYHPMEAFEPMGAFDPVVGFPGCTWQA